MSMKMGMSLDIGFRQELQLTDPEREQINAALNFWDNKPHQQMKISLAELRKMFGGENGRFLPADLNSQSGNHEKDDLLMVEFVVLIDSEMKKLDIDEKYGMLMGTCIFVSDKVPERYLALVLFNMMVLRSVKEKGPLALMFAQMGAKIDESRHWTANLADLIFAEKYFARNPEQFLDYANWRKQIERTNFFNNEQIAEVLNKKLEQLAIARMRHPLLRGGYIATSWKMSTVLPVSESLEAAELAKDLGSHNCDLVLQRIIKEESFVPSKMLELINFLLENFSGNFSFSDNNKTEGLRLIKIIEPQMDVQAYLLTEDIQVTPILEKTKLGHNVYKINPYARKTLFALKDRLMYFGRQRLLKQAQAELVLKGEKVEIAEKITKLSTDTAKQSGIVLYGHETNQPCE